MKTRYFLLLGLALLLLWSFSTRPPAPVEQAVVLKQPANPSSTVPVRAKFLPGNTAEAEDALRRVFGDLVVSKRAERWFITGDFNGDGSDDLAALVHPTRAKLKLINDPLANWTIQDAAHAFFPPKNQTVVFMSKKPAPQTVSAGETLLAVIHGYGEHGWRDARARQAYLVRNAGASPMRAIPAPGHVDGAPASIQHSDVIYQQLDRPGFLFWTGSQYAWRAAAKGVMTSADANARD